MPTWTETETDWEYDVGGGEKVRIPKSLMPSGPNPGPSDVLSLLGQGVVQQAVPPQPTGVDPFALGLHQAGQQLAAEDARRSERRSQDVLRAAGLLPQPDSVVGASPGGMPVAPAAPAPAQAVQEQPGSAGAAAPALQPRDETEASILRSADIAAQQERAKAEGAQRVAGEMRRGADAMEQARAAAKAETDADFARFSSALASLDNVQLKPQVSNGQALALGIGAAIAGFLDPTGPNSVIALAQGMLDRDLAANRAEFEARKSALEGQISLAQQRRFAFKDDMEARAALHEANLKAIEQEALARAAMLNDPAAKERGIQLALEARKEQEALARKRMLEDEAIRFDRKMKEGALAVDRGHLALARDKLADDLAEAAAKVKAAQGTMALFDPFDARPIGNVQSGRPEELDKMRNDVAMAGHVAKQVGKLMQEARAAGSVYSGPKAEWVNSPEAKALKSRYKSLLFDYIKYASGLAYTDKQLDEMVKVVPGVESWITDITGSNPEQAWSKFSEMAAQRLSTRLNAFGALGVDGKPIDWERRFQQMRPATWEEVQIPGAEAPPPAGVARGSRAHKVAVRERALEAVANRHGIQIPSGGRMTTAGALGYAIANDDPGMISTEAKKFTAKDLEIIKRDYDDIYGEMLGSQGVREGVNLDPFGDY